MDVPCLDWLPMLLAFGGFACGGPSAGGAAKPVADPAAAPSTNEPLCKTLQPQFDRLTANFNLGGKLKCEEMPGVVTLGQFGQGRSYERNLLACVDDSSALINAVQVEPAAVASVSYETTATSSEGGVLSLGRIAPWLPDVKAEGSQGSRISLRLTIEEATWETLASLGRVFEGQNHAFDCFPALCRSDARVVYKVLRGKVRVALSTDRANGFASQIALAGGVAGFAVDQQTMNAATVSISSSEKLVIGVVDRQTQTELTDRGDCDGCSASGQACCARGTACDDSLTCIEGTCRPPGYPGTPCDNGRCSHGAACVRGTCHAGCGTSGLPCCDGGACTDAQHCQSGQPARREVNVADEIVERSGGFFGTDALVELGSAACGDGRLRSRFATTKLEGDSAHCDNAQWIEQNDANDCRVRVHVHVSLFGKIRCRVQIVATEIDPRVPAPQALCK